MHPADPALNEAVEYATETFLDRVLHHEDTFA